MNQIFENIFKKFNVSKLLTYKATNSNNNQAFSFYGPVFFLGEQQGILLKNMGKILGNCTNERKRLKR